MNPAIRAKLSVMMFLEYVIYGAWLPLLTLYLGKYLHFTGDERAVGQQRIRICVLDRLALWRAACRPLL